jgi:hypothetical protein
LEISQEELEKEIMDLLLHGDHPTLEVLRQQYISARVISREFSGVGFFTNFEVPNTASAVQPPNFAAGNVDIQMENVNYGVGCVLFIQDGRLSMLEGYTYGEPWPEQIIIKSFSNVIHAIPE